jgi:hypothetical protein
MEKKINKELYRHSNIVIRLLGHTGWMPEDRHAKRALLEGDGRKEEEGMAGGGNNRPENAGRT